MRYRALPRSSLLKEPLFREDKPTFEHVGAITSADVRSVSWATNLQGISRDF